MCTNKKKVIAALGFLERNFANLSQILWNREETWSIAVADLLSKMLDAYPLGPIYSSFWWDLAKQYISTPFGVGASA